jgi:hypothetical protein
MQPYGYEDEPPVGEWMCWALLVLIVAFLLLVAFTGCAHYSINPATGEGSSYGFLRNMSVAEETIIEERADGTIVTTSKKAVTTTSTTADVLLGFNELLGTAVDAAAKVKP